MSFRCDTCPRTFTLLSALKRHKRESCLQVKPKRIYPCAYCQKRFTRLHSMKRHYNVCSIRTLEKYLEKEQEISHSL